MTPVRIHQFGSFRLDASRRVLFRDGQRVALTPRAIDVLVVLVEAAGQPVSRDELLRQVWAGAVVEDGSLTSHVSLLRKALAEGGGDGLIETLSKRGYRFAGAAVGSAPDPAPAAQPRTLTFLFASIEGAVGTGGAAARLRDALQRHGVDRHGGSAPRLVEDSFCLAFDRAAAAMLAAIDVQRALRDPAGAAPGLDACMGLHSGATEEADDFSGPTLARAARVMAAAHGGQILLTAATVALLEQAAPQDGALVDLGDHTLLGFARPERLYQLSGAGLRSEFPPIRTRESMRTNLPTSPTAFIGRGQALAEVGEKVLGSRVVTLVGAGGTGKTRLSLEAARRLCGSFPDGVWLVELAPLADAALVARAIAGTLGARAEGETSPITLIESTLRDRRVLLLLDNCEHVVDEAARVAQALVRMLPRLHLLATSREALGIEGEAIYRVPSLTLPGPHGMPAPPDLVASEAGQLFVERAAAVQPAFVLTDGNSAAIAQICRRLDGIPLAIELAAARLTALSVQEIARRIDDRFRLLSGGLRTAMPRQRTLRALVDWSYDLLSPDERTVLAALSVFAGSFSFEAADRVCRDEARGGIGMLDAIGFLVAKSLLIAQTQDGGETRYRLLETIKQYAGEKLAASGLAPSVQRRHFDYFLGVATIGSQAMAGPMALEWLDRLEADHDNLRAALDWSGEASPADYARLAGALRTFWDTRGHYVEAWARLGRALVAHTARDPVSLEVRIGAGLCAHRLAHAQRSEEILDDAVALAQDLGDARGEAEATLWLAWARLHSQGADVAERLVSRALALARTAGDRRLEAFALTELGKSARGRGEHTRARTLFHEATQLFAATACVIDAPFPTDEAGWCALEQLDFAAARRLLGDALVQHRRIGNVHDAANTQVQLGLLALNEGRLDEALALTSQGLRVFRGLHDPKCAAKTAIAHATILGAMGDAAQAISHAESAVEAYRELGIPMQLARALCTAGCIHAALGHRDAARHALFRGLVEQQRVDLDTYLPGLLEAIAEVHPETPLAAQLLGAAAAQRERMKAPLLPYERDEYERRLAQVRARHPGAKFDRAMQAGRALTRDDAIRSALALQATA